MDQQQQIKLLQADNAALKARLASLLNDVDWQNNTLTEIARIVGLPATQPIRGLTDWIRARWAK